MHEERDPKAAGAVRIRVARGGSRRPEGRPELAGAFAGYLLGSLAGIIFRPPTDTDEGTMVAYFVGGLVGAIVAVLAVPAARRLLGSRLGLRARTWAAVGCAALGSFLAGAIVGFAAQPIADEFLGSVRAGNELLPAVLAAAYLAVFTSLLLVILDQTGPGPAAEDADPAASRSKKAWPVIFAGGLLGGVVGTLGGAMASAVTEVVKGDLPAAEAGARGGMILAGWTGSLVGLSATAGFLLAARLVRRIAAAMRASG